MPISIRSVSRKLISTVMLCTACLPAYTQEDSCSQSIALKNYVVNGNRKASAMKNDATGAFLWSMQMMDELPKILGNADPIHYAQMLPGVQTNNEYRSGVNIQGCENSHNNINIGGIHIYNVNHLLGFFSTFNASHYPTMHLTKSMTSANGTNRIGGELTMKLPETIPDTITGEFSVGLISSQGTLRMPLSNNTSITLSLRGSYMNILYGHWLNAGDMQIKYSFFDSNATLVHKIDKHNTIIADFYGGTDDGTFHEGHYIADMQARWGNYMGAFHWIYSHENISARNTIYTTSYHNTLRLNMQDSEIALPSGITDVGYKGEITIGRMSGGLHTAMHHIRPQHPDTEGTLNIDETEDNATRTIEASLFADYRFAISSKVKVTIGLRGSIYGNRHIGMFAAADPSVAVSYAIGNTIVTAGYSLRHQYLFQTGFSDIGLPTEFWMSSDNKHRPQYAHTLTAGISSYLAGRRFRLSADVFCKRLSHQTEYSGSVLDFVNTAYNLDNMLLHGHGNNYGMSIMLNKCSGKLTGWVSYAYTHARRNFPAFRSNGSFPAAHERPHELNTLLTYSAGNHWSFGTTFVYASGTPFTAPECLSLINGNIITVFGEHNGARLKPYSRLDISVNYRWKGRGTAENGINLSLYNATGRSNELFHYVTTRSDGSFAYRPVSFVLDVLPSISYFRKF